MSAPEGYDGPRWRYRLFDDVEHRDRQRRLRAAIGSAVVTTLALAAMATFALCAFTTTCHV